VNPRFDTEPAPDIVFRVARKPDVWTWTDPQYTGRGRYDDLFHSYRVLYTSTTAFGAYLEKLAQFRPDPRLLAALGDIQENDPAAPKTAPAGTLPAGWRARHILGKGLTDGVREPLVAVGKARSLATLRRALASVAESLGIKEIDAGVIRLDYSVEFRVLTQAISSYVHIQNSEIELDGADFLRACELHGIVPN
jgi:hypothetical protein